MMGIRCDYSDARDCSECNEPICLRFKRRNDWEDEKPSYYYDEE